MHELTGKPMITLTEHDNLEVEDEVVIDWCRMVTKAEDDDVFPGV